VQAPYEPLSSLHWNVAPNGVEVNANDALVEVVGSIGPDVIVVSGAVGAAVIVQLAFAGVASV